LGVAPDETNCQQPTPREGRFMNIVFAGREFHPPTGGGAGAGIHHTSALLARCGHRVFLVTPRANGPDEQPPPPGVEIVETEVSPPRQAGCFFSENQEYSYRVLNTLRGLARKEKLDVVEFADPGAEGFAAIRAKRLLNEFAGTRLIVNGQPPPSPRFQIKEGKILQASAYCDFEMEDYCVRHADLVTAPSSALANYLEERTGRKDIRVDPDPGPDPIGLPHAGSGGGFNPERWLLDNYTRALPERQWRRPTGKKVSVIIPFYNQGQYLAEAIQSVRDSGYPELEIIVVNDGSTDPSAREVFERTEGVVKVRKENGGLSSARNAGIRAATGDYFLMLDADDKIHADYLATAVQALENNPDLAYLASHARCFGAYDCAWIPVGFVPTLMGFMNTAGTCAIVFRRELFATCGGYDERMVSYEDWDFLLTLHDHGLEGDVLPAEFFFYRKHLDSMLHTVASPRRAELIQYMMVKHAGSLQKYAWNSAVALAGLWKREEIRAETLEQRYAAAQDALSRATEGAAPPGMLRRFFGRTLGRKLRSSIRKRLTAARSWFEDEAG
jgi:hypothetical protein